jgi:hypothetical protein
MPDLDRNLTSSNAAGPPAINDLSDVDIDSHQDIAGRNINPAKLTALLRAKFGAGAYQLTVSLEEFTT